MSTPTLLTYYKEKVTKALQAKHNYANVHQIPRLEKIVVTTCMGKHPDRKQAVEDAVAEIAKITGLSQKESQATALFMMLCLSALSAFLYYRSGELSFAEGAVFVPGGIAGAVLASAVFRKIDPSLLKKIFGGFVTFSAARMLWNLAGEIL